MIIEKVPYIILLIGFSCKVYIFTERVLYIYWSYAHIHYVYQKVTYTVYIILMTLLELMWLIQWIIQTFC